MPSRIHMTIDEARREKWAEGRKQYGGDKFVGDDPLIEVDDELLDALNYLDEADRQGYSIFSVDLIRQELRRAALMVRTLYLEGK